MKKYYSDILHRTTQERISVPKRAFKLRASNVPFCLVAHALSIWKTFGGAKLYEKDNLIGGLARELGEVTHQVWQNWLGNTGRLYGYWVCPLCGRIDLGFVRQCPTCYTQRNYRELVYEKPFGIKPDGIIQTYEAEDVDECLELKTIDQEKWDAIEKPVRQHATQALVVAERLQRDGKPIQSAVVVYINRNKPWRYKAFSLTPRPIIDKIISRFERSEHYAKQGRVPKDEYSSDNPLCAWCDWDSICKSPERDETLKRLAMDYVKKAKKADRSSGGNQSKPGRRKK